MSGSSLDETDITAARAIELVADGTVWLLDVREPDEWDAWHVPAAHHIPMRDLAARQHELPDGEQLLVICHVGERSALVRDALLRAGYPAAHVAGGMIAWAASGGTVVPGDGIMETGGA